MERLSSACRLRGGALVGTMSLRLISVSHYPYPATYLWGTAVPERSRRAALRGAITSDQW